MRAGVFALILFALALGGCKPKTVSEAEAKKDVAWLDANGSPEAVQALGRLADNEPKASKALDQRASAQNDVNVYIAAWSAVLRGAGWGATTLRDALSDPARADTAAQAMTRRDAHLATFVNAFEAALVQGGTRTRNLAVASLLASAGPAAHDAIDRRLKAKDTRGAMCRGISSPDAAEDAKQVLMKVTADSRDDVDCVDAIVRIAATDDAAVAWLAASGESGILSAAGKSDVIPCPRLKQLWTEAVQARPAQTFPALAVPLAHAVKRCASALDPFLAETLSRGAASEILVVGGVDPYGTETSDLKQTCSKLPLVIRSGAVPARTRERAADAAAHGCRAANKAR